MVYNALAVCQKPNEKPFIVSIYTYFDKDVVLSCLQRFKRQYKGTEIKVISSWIEKVETNKLDDSKLFNVYIKTNYLRENDYTLVGKYVVKQNAEDMCEDYKNKDYVTDVKIETVDFRELFYKRICERYIGTMYTQILLQNFQNNNSIIHAYIKDEAIDLKYEREINLQNYKEYLKDEESVYEYNTYEDFYKEFVKDYILEDIRDLGLFNGENNEWDFYISYNDIKLLGMEDEINKSIEKEIAEDFKEENEEEQE